MQQHLRKTTAVILLLFSVFIIHNSASSQNVGVNASGAAPNASAMLDVVSSNKGILIPRVTQAQRLAMNPLPAAAQGLTVYQTDGAQGFYYNISVTTTPNWAFLVPNNCTGYGNLIIESTSVTNVNIKADQLCVDSLSLGSINVNAAITSSGAGGLDAGAEAASTWYYLFVISNNDGTSVNGLLSLSSTAPTMPAGYTKKRRVGTVRNDASSNFLQFVQDGDKVLYYDVVVTNRILSAGTSTTFTSISASKFVPPTSRTGLFELTSSVSGNAGTDYMASFRPIGSSASYGIVVQNYNQVTGIVSFNNVIAPVTLDGSQNLEYKITAVPTSGGAYIDVLGYYDRF